MKPTEKGLMEVLRKHFCTAGCTDIDACEGKRFDDPNYLCPVILKAHHAILNEFERMVPEPPLDVIESYMGSELAGQAYADGWNAVIKGFKSKIQSKRRGNGG